MFLLVSIVLFGSILTYAIHKIACVHIDKVEAKQLNLKVEEESKTNE